jgi:hydroxymethylglutaryl-CoA lyase
VDRVLVLGRQLEKTFGRKLRSEAIINGRTQKEGHPEYARPGLAKTKEKTGETPGQKFPSHWAPQAVLPEKYRG